MLELNQFDSLNVDIGADATLSPLVYAASWADVPSAGSLPSNGSDTVATAGPTPIVNGAASVSRLVQTLVIVNSDTASHATIVEKGNGGFYFPLAQAVLSPGDQLHYEHGRGWYVLDSTGATKTAGGGGGGGSPTGPAGGVLDGTYPSPTFRAPVALPAATSLVGWYSPFEPMAWAGVMTPNFVDENNFWLSLTNSTTLAFPNAADGAVLTLALVQGTGGNKTVTWPASVVWPAGGAPVLSTADGEVDFVELVTRNDGTTCTYYGRLLAGNSGDGRVNWVSHTVNFGDASVSSFLFSLPNNAIITEVRVVVDTAFNGTPTVEVGTTINGPAYFLPTGASELTASAGSVFIEYPGRPPLTTRDVLLTYAQGGASVGAARVLVAWTLPH